MVNDKKPAVSTLARAASRDRESTWSIQASIGGPEGSRRTASARTESVESPSPAAHMDGTASASRAGDVPSVSSSQLTPQALAALQTQHTEQATSNSPYSLFRYLRSKQRHEQVASGIVQGQEQTGEIGGQQEQNATG